MLCCSSHIQDEMVGGATLAERGRQLTLPMQRRRIVAYRYLQQLWNRKKVLVILLMVIGITGLHIFISGNYEKTHAVARELYYLPIILSVIWFGLRGAIMTSLSITVLYLAFSVSEWRGFSGDDMNRLLEILLFNIVAVIMGILQDRQRERNREKLEVIKALAGTVAHEMNSPLFVAIGTLEVLQENFAQGSEPYQEIDHTMKNLKQLKSLIKKISQLEEVVTKSYHGTSKIVDLDRSSSISP